MPDNTNQNPRDNIRRIKNKTGNFSIILNDVLQRPDLSARAKGIFAYIMTLPDNWVLRKSELYTHFSEGRDSLDSAFKELENINLIARQIVRCPDSGKILGSHYIAYETPQSDGAGPESNRVTEKRHLGESSNSAPESSKPAENAAPDPESPDAEIHRLTEKRLLGELPHPAQKNTEIAGMADYRLTEKPIDGKTDSRENRLTVFPQLLNTKLTNTYYYKKLNLQNPSSASSSPPETQNQKTEAEAMVNLKSVLKSIHHELVFSGDFYPRAACFMADKELDAGYPPWLYQYCKSLNPKSLTGFYYKVFTDGRFAELYLCKDDHTPNKPPDTVSCPACGAEIPYFDNCPRCGLQSNHRNDDEIIEQHRRIARMPPDIRAKYDAATNSIHSFGLGNLDAAVSRLRQINQEFGVA